MSRYRRTSKLSLPIIDRVAELERVYASLPKIVCKNLCKDSCGPLAVAPLERKRVEEYSGRELYADAANMTCNVLQGGLCTAHAVRPLLCRLFGVVRKMQCPFGCMPERFVSDEEARRLLKQLEYVAGPLPPGVDMRDPSTGIVYDPDVARRHVRALHKEVNHGKQEAPIDR